MRVRIPMKAIKLYFQARVWRTSWESKPIRTESSKHQPAPSLCNMWTPTPCFHLKLFYLCPHGVAACLWSHVCPLADRLLICHNEFLTLKCRSNEFYHPSTTHPVSPSPYIRQPPWHQAFCAFIRFAPKSSSTVVSSNKMPFTIIYNYGHVMFCTAPINSRCKDLLFRVKDYNISG